MSDGIIDLVSFLMGGASASSATVAPYAPLSYPIEMPPVSGIRSITWYKDRNNQFTESPHNFKRFYFKKKAARWRAVVELPIMTPEHAGKWRGFLDNLEGGLYTFWFGDVLHPEPEGVAFGSPVIASSGQSGTVVQVAGFLSNIEGVLKAGDKIQIQNSLYEITRDANSQIDGSATLDIFPHLKSSPPSGATVITSNARGLFRLNTSSYLSQVSSLSRAAMPISFEVVEAE